jgi:hypothetical protein
MHVVLCLAYLEQDVAFDKIARLLIGMAVLRQDALPRKNEFGHQGPGAKDQRLLSYPTEHLSVTLFTMLAELYCCHNSSFDSRKFFGISFGGPSTEAGLFTQTLTRRRWGSTHLHF